MRYAPPLFLTLVTSAALVACQGDKAPLPLEPDIEAEPPRMNPLVMEVEGYPTPGEADTGFIFNRYGNAVEVEYEIHDGLAIWQGDIVIGKAGEVPKTRAELMARTSREVETPPGMASGVVTDDNAKRWPNGVIPYTIDDADNAIVMAAIEWVEDQTPGVTLVARTTETNYVTFRDASGCSSDIGMTGGQQFINLKVNDGESFCSTGNAAHEILHALGMYHEHTRCDRDSFVTIDYDEIEDGREGNFYKAGAGTEAGACSNAYDIDAYDFESIMHYPLDAFADGSEPTIIPVVDVTGLSIGQRSALGPTDVETINQLYGSNNATPVADIAGPTGDLLEGSVLSFDATGSTDADDDYDILTFDWSFGDGTCTGGSPPSACTDDDPDHTYADDGTYGYSVTVSDGFDEGAAGATVTIANVAPTVDAGPDTEVDEGSPFTRNGSFTDPGADSWSATVDYDDGSGSEPLVLTGKTFSLVHTYVDNGVNTVTVTVTDDDDGVGTDNVDVTVLNVAPTVDAGPDATVESGETYAFSGTFSDPGIEDDPWSWTIDWGFGDDTTGETSDQSAPIEASRQVCLAGTYSISLTVTDKDDDEGSDALTLTVPHVPVLIDIMPGTDINPVNLKQGGNLPVAVLGSMDLDAASLDPATLTLGDETDLDTPVGQKNNGTYEAYLEDVNRDGYMDLVIMFPVRDLVNAYGDLTAASTELVLRGFLDDGCTNIRGSDVVTPR